MGNGKRDLGELRSVPELLQDAGPEIQEWRVANGKWETGNGKWQVEDG